MRRESLHIASMFPKPSGTLRLLGRHYPEYKQADYLFVFAINRVVKTCKLHFKSSNVHSKLLPQFLHFIPTRLILKDFLYQLLLINYFKSAPRQKIKKQTEEGKQKRNLLFPIAFLGIWSTTFITCGIL
jgi:hypothetical protein